MAPFWQGDAITAAGHEGVKGRRMRTPAPRTPIHKERAESADWLFPRGRGRGRRRGGHAAAGRGGGGAGERRARRPRGESRRGAEVRDHGTGRGGRGRHREPTSPLTPRCYAGPGGDVPCTGGVRSGTPPVCAGRAPPLRDSPSELPVPAGHRAPTAALRGAPPPVPVPGAGAARLSVLTPHFFPRCRAVSPPCPSAATRIGNPARAPAP